MSRIYLSPPTLSGDEAERIRAALESNWIAPIGPDLDGFEQELCDCADRAHAVALSSGTAALHLAMDLVGVQPGDRVLCPTLTFAATANAICYAGGRPVFIDSEEASWNLDPELLAAELARSQAERNLPKAVVTVDLYGQTADYDRIAPICEQFQIPLIEDAAEALGALHRTQNDSSEPATGSATNSTTQIATEYQRPAGSFGQLAIFSFNGNKIITASSGGVLLSDDPSAIERARYLATQARQPAAHYEHTEVGYNYRLSNILAALGRGQLATLNARVEHRRQLFERYVEHLGDLAGVRFQPEAPWTRSNRWLTVMTLDPERAIATPEEVRLALEDENIESRPVWKPMHLQPAFRTAERVGGAVAERLFATGLCLPSGHSLDDEGFERIVGIVRRVLSCA